MLGFVVVFIITAPIAGGGLFVMLRGRREESAQAEADQQRKLLDMVMARGQISVSDVIIELQSDFQSVKDIIYRLVGLGVFSGYVNWDEGTLYSAEAADLHAISECKNCGGSVSFAGKGVQQCPHCGTEYFLAK
jgi:Fe2+ or Zn2+ uptake regulation protein